MGAHGKQAVAETLHQLVQSPEVDPFVGAQWVEMSIEANDSRIGMLVEGLRGATPAAVQAAHALLTRWAQRNERDNVTRFVNTNSEWLRKDDLLWGGAGYALTTIRAWTMAANWMSDWKSRTDAKPWMLVNTAESLRAVGKDSEAAECSKCALALPPDNGTRLHELLLAADAAFRGDFRYVAEHLPAVADRESLDLDYKFLVALVEAVMDVAQSSESERGRAFRRAMRQIDTAKAEYSLHLPHEPARQRFVEAASRQAAKEARRWWAWVWYYVRKLPEFRIA
jgi:cellulose synthase operon protein C